MVEMREMALAELDRVNEISVTERGYIVYTYFEGDIVAQPEVWQRPPRSREGWQVLVDRWTGYLHRGGVILGAFDGELLVGMTVVRYKLTATQAELAGLFVSEAYRRQASRWPSSVEPAQSLWSK